MKNFEKLGLNPNLLRVLKEINFDEPSEIQEKVIPIALSGHDVIGGSATGSGKTLAFGAPIIEKIKPGWGLQSLILTPTRELAEQVAKSISIFSKYSQLKIVTVYGGVSISNQINELRRAEVVVGTPGRVLDHIKRRTINLSKIKILVLDEADRMLDMGFIHDVTTIVSYCPTKRQTLLFSATISEEIIKISKKYMENPKEVSVDNRVDPSKLEQVFYDVPSNQKFSLLVHLLKDESSKLVMIFCNTKRNCDLIARNLKQQGFDAMALHGDLNQSKRNRILEHFHKSHKFILVCTDVAARGLDIKGVSHVYNYESPKTSTEYIHRIGRTARAGKDGKAITIISERDYENFRRVKEDDSLGIKNVALPEFQQVFVEMRSKDNFGRQSYGQRRFSNSRRPFRSGSHPRDHRSGEITEGNRFGRNRDSRFRGNR
ncbi:DEAD/DEAH box helicase [Candidatus Pacearchaeota archaeon]|nr:DEAD/DEAH box helicase [Candidatus Pacearchaeota archaeon]